MIRTHSPPAPSPKTQGPEGPVRLPGRPAPLTCLGGRRSLSPRDSSLPGSIGSYVAPEVSDVTPHFRNDVAPCPARPGRPDPSGVRRGRGPRPGPWSRAALHDAAHDALD